MAGRGRGTKEEGERISACLDGCHLVLLSLSCYRYLSITCLGMPQSWGLPHKWVHVTRTGAWTLCMTTLLWDVSIQLKPSNLRYILEINECCRLTRCCTTSTSYGRGRSTCPFGISENRAAYVTFINQIVL